MGLRSRLDESAEKPSDNGARCPTSMSDKAVVMRSVSLLELDAAIPKLPAVRGNLV